MASRLEVRSLKDVPRFFRASMRAWKQVKGAPGALGASLVAEPLKRTFWTLSAWEGREELYAYVKAEPHHTVMTSMRPTMKGSVFTFWEVPVDELPIAWPDARRRLAEQQRADAS
jgi:heme-degrading monooxygenase HmoA